MSVSTTLAPSRTTDAPRAAEAHQLALERSRCTGQQRYLALEPHSSPPASPLIGREDAPFRVVPLSTQRGAA